VLRADRYVHDLARQRIGDGCYGFCCTLTDVVLGNGIVLEARLANLSTPVGAPITLDRPCRPTPDLEGPGALRWLGGLRFAGWLCGDTEPPAANALVDGTLVMQIRALSFSHVSSGEEDFRAVRAFDLHLPNRFADARPHQLAVVTERGENVSGSPLTFLAFADGLREAIAQQGLGEQELLRAELFDRLLPMAMPLSQYASWRSKLKIVSGPSAAMRTAVLLVGPGRVHDTLASLHRQSHADWVAASLPPTSEPTGFCPELVQSFLSGEAAGCELVVFGLAGTQLEPDALARIAGAFSTFPEAGAVYADIEIESADGSAWPIALSAFDYERMLEQGYCAHLFALRLHAAERSLSAGAQNLYRLFNALLDGSVPTADIVHLPCPLARLPAFDRNAASISLAAATDSHLRRRGINADVTTSGGSVFPAVRVTRTAGRQSTTIVVPTRNRRDLLEACIESIRPTVERHAAQLMVIDNDSEDAETVDYLAQIERQGGTVLRVPGPFNFARLNNRAAEAAAGDVLCLFNNDVRAVDHGWLNELLGRLQDDVGAVGALLLWPSGVVQHGGVVLGPNFSVAHAFDDRIDGDGGYGDLLRVAHECSAVTAACLVTRRRDYLDVRGMDEVCFPVNFNDVDYCLKLRSRGCRVVFTPHARLVHHESASRGADLRRDRRHRYERELQNLRAKWGLALEADPYYSPLLSRDSLPFTALAWPPPAMRPRLNVLPSPAEVPPGF
jgi:O-antigen biosynthesis protein